MLQYKDILLDYLVSLGVDISWAKYLNLFVEFLALAAIVIVLDWIIKAILVQSIHQFAKRSKTKFDDYLVENNVPKFLARVIPLVLFYELIPFVFSDFLYVGNIVTRLTEVYAILLGLWIFRSLLNSLKFYFRTMESMKDKPIESYIQVFMIFAWVAGVILSLAVLTGTPVWKYFTALGAASAVIILVFQDSIKGFVASIQVSINDMVRIGDWITFSKYGADGDVFEINLATVKVRNFDKTFTTIPTYALISDSFQNWRGMQESPGRRIKRSVLIKQESIRFLKNEEIDEFKKIQLITKYLENRQKDIDSDNQKIGADKSLAVNGRNMTNFGVFRKYIETYLQNHSAVNKEMMIMVRQLEPTATGIPLQIYCFSSDKRWENYEYIMADIFDHVIAAAPYFKLSLFESEDSRRYREFPQLS